VVVKGIGGNRVTRRVLGIVAWLLHIEIILEERKPCRPESPTSMTAHGTRDPMTRTRLTGSEKESTAIDAFFEVLHCAGLTDAEIGREYAEEWRAWLKAHPERKPATAGQGGGVMGETVMVADAHGFNTSLHPGGPKWALTCGKCGLTFRARIPMIDSPGILCPHCGVVNTIPVEVS